MAAAEASSESIGAAATNLLEYPGSPPPSATLEQGSGMEVHAVDINVVESEDEMALGTAATTATTAAAVSVMGTLSPSVTIPCVINNTAPSSPYEDRPEILAVFIPAERYLKTEAATQSAVVHPMPAVHGHGLAQQRHPGNPTRCQAMAAPEHLRQYEDCFPEFDGAKFVGSGQSAESLKMLGVEDEHARAKITTQAAKWRTIQEELITWWVGECDVFVYTSLSELRDHMKIKIMQERADASEFEVTLAREVNTTANKLLRYLDAIVLCKDGVVPKEETRVVADDDEFTADFCESNAQTHGRLLDTLLGDCVQWKAAILDQLVKEQKPQKLVTRTPDSVIRNLMTLSAKFVFGIAKEILFG